MSINLSIADLFAEVFGYGSQAFEPQFKHVVGNGNSLTDRKELGLHGAPYYAQDQVTGREYYLPVTISYPDSSPLPVGSVKAGGAVGFAPVPTNTGVLLKWELPHPVVSISSKKTIIETALTERRGTVKELINIEDYQITIRGLIIGGTNELPEADVAKLVDIYELNVAVTITNALTDIFLLKGGSERVVIKSLDFPEVKGVKNVRGYTLVMVSDQSFSLEEIN